MDFQDDDPQPEATKAAVDEAAEAERKKKDKKMKRLTGVSGGHETDHLKGTPTPAGSVRTAGEANSKKGKTKSGDTNALSVNRSEKKRKRDSEGHSKRLGGTSDHGLGDNEMQSKARKTALNGTSLNLTEAQPLGQDGNTSKKRKKDKRKLGTHGPQEVTGNPVTPANTTKSDKPRKSKATKKTKKDKKDKKRESSAAKDASVQSIVLTTTVSPYATTPKQTPIPLPEKSTVRATSSVRTLQQQHVPHRGGFVESPVNETPSLQRPRQASVSRKTPIPFNFPQASGIATGGKQLMVFPTNEASQLPTSGSAACFKSSRGAIEHEVPALTSSNLLRYTQPLNDDPKPRPRGRAASVSSVSSMSIKDAFARRGKPSPSSSFDFDPFFTPESREKKQPVTQKEASVQDFNSAFDALQAAVDFTAETSYLQQRLQSKAAYDAAGPLPCLKTATGCSSKSEQVLQLMREDDSNVLKINICSDAEQAAFDHSVAATLEAERFLSNAVMARNPVPLGKLEGVYTLYCPKYSSVHIDKYGYGQRTLSIQRPSGFNPASHTYTARLSIPPRPMAYTILAFNAPPHASFRCTTLTTSAEGYTMSLACLGNGYLVLRMDMGLLLTGKKSEMAGKEGEGCMEFLGVRERDVDGMGALEWDAMERKVRKEVEAKINSEKGLGDNGVRGSIETSPKKKRGRPTNVERERRALEAAAQS
jgi:hypothetical protein